MLLLQGIMGKILIENKEAVTSNYNREKIVFWSLVFVIASGYKCSMCSVWGVRPISRASQGKPTTLQILSIHVSAKQKIQHTIGWSSKCFVNRIQ